MCHAWHETCSLTLIMQRKLHRQNGFTLIEVMIVVAIIGILASIAIPQFQNFSIRSRRSEANELLRAVLTAQDAYLAIYNHYCFSNGGNATWNIHQAIGLADGNGPIQRGKYYDTWVYLTPQIPASAPPNAIFTADNFNVFLRADFDADPTDFDTVILRTQGSAFFSSGPYGVPALQYDDITNQTFFLFF